LLLSGFRVGQVPAVWDGENGFKHMHVVSQNYN
jgi:hypothetical protein